MIQRGYFQLDQIETEALHALFSKDLRVQR